VSEGSGKFWKLPGVADPTGNRRRLRVSCLVALLRWAEYKVDGLHRLSVS